jgi:drug/metabolite transporter (DMT)-like permease
VAEIEIPDDLRAAARPASALVSAGAFFFVLLWAAAFVPSRILARNAPPLGILVVRFVLSGALLLGVAAAQRLPFPRDRATWLRLLALGVLGNALYLGCNYLALKHLTAGMGSIIASTNPLLLALVAPALLGEPLTRRKALGMIFGFSGVLLAMHTRAGTQTARLQDVLLAACGVLAAVGSNIVYKRMRTRPHPLVLNGAQLFLAGAVLVPASLALEGTPHISWTTPVIVSFAALVLFLSVGGSLLWFWILRHGEASRVSAYFFLTPVFGLLLGAALLGERLLPMDAPAIAIIALGLWLATHEKKTPPLN